MKNIFADAMKSMREEKFPGESLRRVNEHFKDAGLGEFFYTQINKVENGVLSPSVELLETILKIYQVNKTEKEEIFKKLLVQNILEVEESLPIKRSSVDDAFAMYRRIKKK